MDFTEEEFRAHVKAYNNRINKVAWLNGLYSHSALNCILGNMFLEKGKQPIQYPNEPYGSDENVQEKQPLSVQDKQELLQQALSDVY